MDEIRCNEQFRGVKVGLVRGVVSYVLSVNDSENVGKSTQFTNNHDYGDYNGMSEMCAEWSMLANDCSAEDFY